MSCSKCSSNKLLNIKTLNDTPLNSLIELYKNGYKIEEFNSGMIIKGLSSCPLSIQQGTTKPLTIIPSSGTPPYKLELIVDNISVLSNNNLTGAYTFNYTFNESIGNHIYTAKLTDSCPSGAKIISDTPCTINITSTPPVNNYGCVNGVCTPGAGTLPTGCNNTCQLPTTGCINCDLTLNYCISGICIPKKYALFGGIGIGVMLLLVLKK